MKNYDLKIKILGINIFSIEIKKGLETDDIAKVIEKKVEPKKIEPIHDNSYQGSVKPDLKELERQLNPVDTIPPIKVTCESCSGITYDDDIDICSTCGKPVCSMCGNNDLANISGILVKQVHCTDCWKTI